MREDVDWIDELMKKSSGLESMTTEEDEDLVCKQATTTKKKKRTVPRRARKSHEEPGDCAADPRVKKSQAEPRRTRGSCSQESSQVSSQVSSQESSQVSSQLNSQESNQTDKQQTREFRLCVAEGLLSVSPSSNNRKFPVCREGLSSRTPSSDKQRKECVS